VRREFPNDELFVMGDFNQDLTNNPPRYYGSIATRECLEKAMASVSLVAATGGDNDPVRDRSPPCACVDHIYMNATSDWKIENTMRWPDLPRPDKTLTDHFGIAVNLYRMMG